MPVDFVDRLEEQLREAAAVPPAVRRRRRVAAAARPAAAMAAVLALSAGAVGALAAGSAGGGGDGAGIAAGEPPAPERPPSARPVPGPAVPSATTPAAPPVPAPPPGSSTTPAAPPVPAPPPEDLVPAQLPSVRVLNGTTTSGLAQRVARVVAGLGYRSLPWGNAASYAVARTQVHASAGAEPRAHELAATLGVPQSAVRPLDGAVAAQADGAQVVVVVGARPRVPREHGTLLLRGPAGARGQATAVVRGDGSVAVSLRTSGVSTLVRRGAWVPGRRGWTLVALLPPGAGRGGATVITPAGRGAFEGFLLTDEPGSARPRTPGTTLLTSKR
jgi:hypothetical protein